MLGTTTQNVVGRSNVEIGRLCYVSAPLMPYLSAGASNLRYCHFNWILRLYVTVYHAKVTFRMHLN